MAEVATLKSQQSRKAVSYLQRSLAEEQLKLEQLQNCRSDYQLSPGSSSARSAIDLKNRERFSSKVDLAVAQQKQQITEVDRQLQRVEENWKRLYSRSKSFEKSCEQARASELLSDNKREQKEVEDSYRY